MTPVALARPRFTRKGHCYTPSKSVSAKNTLQKYMILAMRGRKIFEGSLKLTIQFYFLKSKTARGPLELFPCKKPDLSNLLKLWEDAANKIVWSDDCQLIKIQAEKLYDTYEHVDAKVEVLW